MNFLIFGAGALGQALGCMLAAGGHNVDLILRKRFMESVSKNGLQVSGIFGTFSATPPNLELFSVISNTSRSYDFVLITTKAYDTTRAAKEISTIEKRLKYVVSMQNGCGNVEILAKMFSPERTLGGRIITGFEITTPGKVKITVSADDIHLGSSKGGETSEAAQVLAEVLSDSGHPTIAVDDIHQSLYAKLLYNCTLNPLGALLGVHYGLLSEKSETVEIMNRIIDETFAVVTALGGTTPWPDSSSYKKIFYNTLLPATYNHRPSMLQDLENNKPTEVDALVGYVSMKGRQFSIPTPTCDTLEAMVKFKQTLKN